jgi:hypothetical protein
VWLRLHSGLLGRGHTPIRKSPAIAGSASDEAALTMRPSDGVCIEAVSENPN